MCQIESNKFMSIILHIFRFHYGRFIRENHAFVHGNDSADVVKSKMRIIMKIRFIS